MTVTTEAVPAARLRGWDCIELWVGNARTMSGFLMSAFGFRCTGYAGPESGVRDKASYVLEQGDIRLVVSRRARRPTRRSPRTSGPTVTGCTTWRGWSTTPTAAFEAAVARGRPPGATALGRDGRGRRPAPRHRRPPTATHSTPSSIARATSAPSSSPDTTRTTCRPSPPARRSGSAPSTTSSATSSRDASTIGCTSTRTCMGFSQLVHFDDEQISTEYSALMSTVVWDGTRIVMPLNEPARRAEEEPDPGVPRDLRRAGCAAHRPPDRRTS